MPKKTRAARKVHRGKQKEATVGHCDDEGVYHYPAVDSSKTKQYNLARRLKRSQATLSWTCRPNSQVLQCKRSSL
jgi:hypothetical protein